MTSEQKTPEQLAEEYADENGITVGCDRCELYSTVSDLQLAFLAGRASAEPKWIRVEDGLPENNQPVLAYDSQYQIWDIAFYEEGYWYEDGLHRVVNPTHWMPLPIPPKEDV